jgi:hypothetical protein
MTQLPSYRLIFRLATAAALLAIGASGPNSVPHSAADQVVLGLPSLAQPGKPASGPATPRLQNFARTPLSFEANQDQTDAQVQYLARGPGYTVFLTATEAVLALRPAATAANSRGMAALPRTRRGSAGSAIAQSGEGTVDDVQAVVRMQLLGSNPESLATGADQQPGRVNYFRGNDPSKWRTQIPTYARVKYEDVYPGIGLVYYGNQKQLEYDFVVGPGADAGQIRLWFAGAQSLNVNDDGDLEVRAGEQVLLQHKPVVYQEMAGERRQVAANFVVHGQEVSFTLGGYDRDRPLVIDPVLSYSTYLGGSASSNTNGDQGYGIAVDAAGNVYVSGLTASPDFPTAKALQPNNAGDPSMAGNAAEDAFVTKLSADGTVLVYSTYLGGSDSDQGHGIAVDSSGNAYVTGFTYSVDFPTVNPLQGALERLYHGNAFVAKLSADGSALIYSTYLGGSGNNGNNAGAPGWDQGTGIAVNALGNAYVTGWTDSRDFPTVKPLQGTFRGNYLNAFVCQLTADGSALIYSTYLGGSGPLGDYGSSIALDAAGNAHVTGFTTSPDFPTVNALQPVLRSPPDAFPGSNAFVAKLTADGSALVYSTYLGGTGANDVGTSIAVDVGGNAFVTGSTSSPDFPTANALQPTLRGAANAFVAKLSPDGSTLVYSTYLGGSKFEGNGGIAVDAAGNAYVVGQTLSPDFPTVNALQGALGSPNGNGFVAELSADGSAMVYSTYLGGSGGDLAHRIALDAAGNAYVTGWTSSADFPTANPLQPTLKGSINAFVTKIRP